MSPEVMIEQLQAENAQLREQYAQVLAENARVSAAYARVEAENHQFQEQLKKLEERVHELEGRVVKDSSTSHKPPSSDGYGKKTKSLRQRSGRTAGGQKGHEGSTHEWVEEADEVVVLHPERCTHCQANLDEGTACGVERRQQVDLPLMRAHVTEYQAEIVRCPQCQECTQASFPPQVRARMQYGPMLKGIALYLLYGQLLPYARTAELLSDLCGCPLSPGTLESFVAEGAERLGETEEQMKQGLREAEVIGADETGVRVEGKLYWLHTARSESLTHYAVDRRRGKAATDAINILPQFHGVVVHDGFSLYPQYMQCEHALCNAHILRELRFLYEQEHQSWAGQMMEHLLFCHRTGEEARARGEVRLPAEVIERLTATYHWLIQIGLQVQPPPPPVPKGSGRAKQTRAKNLLDRLERDAAAVLRFLSDFRVPFTNNGSEQDLRMVKVQQKISGTFRSQTGPTSFCRIRGYFSTMTKQGHRLCLVARQLFAGNPFSPLPSVSLS
jgi:transposase